MSHMFIVPLHALGSTIGKLDPALADRLAGVEDRIENTCAGWETDEGLEDGVPEHEEFGGIRSFGGLGEAISKGLGRALKSSKTAKLASKHGLHLDSAIQHSMAASRYLHHAADASTPAKADRIMGAARAHKARDRQQQQKHNDEIGRQTEDSSPESKLARKFGQKARTNAISKNGTDNHRASSELHASAAEKIHGSEPWKVSAKKHHRQAAAAYRKYAREDIDEADQEEAHEYTDAPKNEPLDSLATFGIPGHPLDPVPPNFDDVPGMKKVMRGIMNAMARSQAQAATNLDPSQRDHMAGASERAAVQAWKLASHTESTKPCCAECGESGGSCKEKVHESLATAAAGAELGASIAGPVGAVAGGYLGNKVDGDNDAPKKDKEPKSADDAEGMDDDKESDESRQSPIVRVEDVEIDEAQIKPGSEGVYHSVADDSRKASRFAKDSKKSTDPKRAALAGSGHKLASASHRYAANASMGRTQKRHLAAAAEHDRRGTPKKKEDVEKDKGKPTLLDGKKKKYGKIKENFLPTKKKDYHLRAREIHSDMRAQHKPGSREHDAHDQAVRAHTVAINSPGEVHSRNAAMAGKRAMSLNKGMGESVGQKPIRELAEELLSWAQGHRLDEE